LIVSQQNSFDDHP